MVGRGESSEEGQDGGNVFLGRSRRGPTMQQVCMLARNTVSIREVCLLQCRRSRQVDSDPRHRTLQHGLYGKTSAGVPDRGRHKTGGVGKSGEARTAHHVTPSDDLNARSGTASKNI